MTEARMLFSVKVALDCRLIISVNCGCLNVPGEGFASLAFVSVVFAVRVLGAVTAPGVDRAVKA